MTKLLFEALWRTDPRVRYEWRQLSADQKREVEAAFRRHYAACRNNGLDTEPQFLRECIQDIKAGLHEPADMDVRVPVGDMVQTAFATAGGVGDAGAVRIR